MNFLKITKILEKETKKYRQIFEFVEIRTSKYNNISKNPNIIKQ